MTRWMRVYRNADASRRVAPALPFSGFPVSPDAENFERPSLEELRSAQRKHRAIVPHTAICDEDGMFKGKDSIWIPGKYIDLQLRLLTIAHAGKAEHRGIDPTFNFLPSIFHWTDQREDVRLFVSSFLLCILAKSGNKIPRPYHRHYMPPNGTKSSISIILF